VAFTVIVAEFREAVPVAEEMVGFDVAEEVVRVGRAEMLSLSEDRMIVPLVGFDVLVSGVVDCRVVLALVLVTRVVGWRVALARVLAVVDLAPPPPVDAEAMVQEVAAPFPSSLQVRG
jgi:hypothetical protein